MACRIGMRQAALPFSVVARSRTSSAIRFSQIGCRPISHTDPPKNQSVPEHSAIPRTFTWPHKGWNEQVIQNVIPTHRKPRTMGDRIAWRVTRMCRWAMDLTTGMGPEQHNGGRCTTTTAPPNSLTEPQWLVRFIFLESIAGVPGMVAGTLRHLHSLRRLRADQGWIKTLLEESYNERMHLLTFLELYRPGPLMRLLVFVAQGIFYNCLFAAYLISPSFCHRFVGYLEEEAVHTYTRCLAELDKGCLPQWTDKDFRVPDIAVQYWGMQEGRRSMRDLLLLIRADEASHRGVNHTLGNLDQTLDPNPFVDRRMSQSHMQVAAMEPDGLERAEAIKQ